VITREAISFDLLRIQYRLAARSVKCPKCDAHPGQECESTGGGNRALVPTHKARWARLAGWSEEQMAAANALVRKQGSTWWPRLPAGFYAAQEASAAPIPPKVKAVTPKGVRLSEQQAERVELAAANGGVYHVSTAHFHGDAADRQSVNALEEKGILRFVALTDSGYGRRMELTEFGWKVYHQHRLVIRRVPDDQHPPTCPCRPSTPFEQVEQVNRLPAVQGPQRELQRTWERIRPTPALRLVSVRSGAPTEAKVLDLTSRLAARAASTGGDVA
jgi:hypothetical protein